MRDFELSKLGIAFNWPSAFYAREDFTPIQLGKMAVAGLSALNGSIGGVEAVPTQVAVPTTVGGAIIAPKSTVGKVIAIFKCGPYPIVISDGGVPTLANGTAAIAAGGYWERPKAACSAIKAIANGGSSNVTVTTY